MQFDLNKIVRPNILSLQPYSSARDEYTGTANIYLDANENPFNNGLNRYPDPYQWRLKSKIASIKNVKQERIILGNGSDEIIDLLYRVFCIPQQDEVLILPPTYGMYEVYANINEVKINTCLLNSDFDINEAKLFSSITPNTKIIWFCSPNNPSGNALNPDAIKKVLNQFNGIVVIDEAYIDFSYSQTWTDFLDFHPNLVILQTLSKAWGLAGIRLGIGFASQEIVKLLNKVKPPYNINTLTQDKALSYLDQLEEKNQQVDSILKEREILSKALASLPNTIHVYPSDANFVLVKIHDADTIYTKLVTQSIIVRNRSKVALCEDCLRITIGTPEENKQVLEALKKLQ